MPLDKDTIRVISAMPLSEANRSRIEATFNKKHSGGRLPDYHYEVRPSLIGGVLIIDSERYYDGTVKGQLTKLKKSL